MATAAKVCVVSSTAAAPVVALFRVETEIDIHDEWDLDETGKQLRKGLVIALQLKVGEIVYFLRSPHSSFNICCP